DVAIRPAHATHLRQHRARVREVVEREARDHDREGAVGPGQRRHVALRERHVREPGSQLARPRQHGGRDVDAGRVPDDAGERGDASLAGCTLVTTCAPCIMCTGAIHWAGVSRVVAAARASDAEALGFVEGPPGFDAAAALRALGVTYVADVERDAAVGLLRTY